MICSTLLSPVKNQENYSIYPILELGDFVIYKKVSNIKFYNSISVSKYLKNDNELNDIFFEENVYFISSYKLFFKEFEKDNQIIINLQNHNRINEFKLNQLNNLLNIIKDNGKGGALILFDNHGDKYIPYYIFGDPYMIEEEAKILIEKQKNANDLDSQIFIYDNFVNKLKLANETFLDKNSQISYFINTIIVMNIEKAIFNLN
ncbi:hypothetical protein [Metamycoplasma gateae]|uniref:Uncharacterized protein n=1 Tax=Metamycoplasma gateae TaxID=35769 RepID=A0ABZ2AIN3_9BACT|nr:hypothetical protein V2E26_01455 [Metamycoplasma gateae]